MLEWIKDNSGAISAVANVATLVVWALYFHLLLDMVRHQTRSKILINLVAGDTADAHCLVTNMSSEPLYVESILLSFRTDDKRITCSLSEMNVSLSDQSDKRSQWFQGPLNSGEHIDIGQFRALMERCINAKAEIGEDVVEIDSVAEVEFAVIGTYTADDGVVAAERAFDLKWSDRGTQLVPQTIAAHQIRSSRSRREMERRVLARRQRHARRWRDVLRFS